MFKKIILTFFILTISLFSVDDIFAYSVPVQNVFSDIDANYKYLHELQTLYDKWMIYPDSDWKFNPRALLNRDEFVWILTEVTCKKCIQPNTVMDLINKYENKAVFYDIDKTNKYYYCIAYSNDNWFVSGYHPWTPCDDGTVKVGEKPFCASNTIILEEAIAVILKTSWILTNKEADEMRQDILDWKITEKISDDVGPKNLDGSVYSFYPDLKKALEFEVREVDTNWNVKTYNLIEKIDWKIRPKQTISKEMFLRIAYVTLKANSCQEEKKSNLALKINIYDKKCSSKDENCNFSNLNDPSNTYDLEWEVYTTCKEWILDPEWYIRRFYNYDTWVEIKKYWEYIDNYEFLSEGTWKVFLRAIDKCWNTGEVYNTINVKNKTELRVSIKAKPIYWNWPLLVDYEWIVSWWKGPYIYFWNFWDWNTWYWQDIQNIFKKEWIYETVLEVIDSRGEKASASVIIQVLNVDNDADTDKDWVKDIDDLCPLVKWILKNKWCPILENECSNNECEDWYVCNSNNVCLPESLSNSCEYTWWDLIIWNVVCNSCPCSNSLDFISKLRKCDIIFPAITSIDSKIIFSKGPLFQLK